MRTTYKATSRCMSATSLELADLSWSTVSSAAFKGTMVISTERNHSGGRRDENGVGQNDGWRPQLLSCLALFC